MFGGIVNAIGGALGTVGGPLLNYFGQKETNKTNRQISDADRSLQEMFAQHGIQWRVEDARRAGINPLVALGAQTHMYQPSAIGFQSPMSALGQSMQNMGNFRQYARARGLEPNQPDLKRTVKDPQKVAYSNKSNKSITAGIHPAISAFRAGNKIILAPSERFASSTEEYLPAKAALFEKISSGKIGPIKHLIPRGKSVVPTKEGNLEIVNWKQRKKYDAFQRKLKNKDWSSTPFNEKLNWRK